jgi:adenosylmethionine-8-amino-7-oxononanoate aminotransferase
MTVLADRAAASLIDRDRGLLWHPYAPLDGPEPYAVTDASGIRLEMLAADGTRFEAIDGMSSWWCAIHGYRNPELDAAAHSQIGRFSHVMFGGLTHEPAVLLAEELRRITPPGLEHVFFADSGSVSVEVALKLAVQYQAATGHGGRRKFLALRGGYHGDTVAAMSVCDPVSGMHALFPDLVPGQFFLPRPPAGVLVDGTHAAASESAAVEVWIDEMEVSVARHAQEIAAIIVEPVLQGAGGMYVYDPRCLSALRDAADRHGILLIADEIATGFGRTGALFGCEWAGVTADVMCVGKALTGGYVTLAAVLTTGRVAEAITRSPQRALLHGPTFMANPLACSVALASLRLLDDRWRDQVARIGSTLAASLAPAARLDCVADVRVLGAVGVVELSEPVDVAAMTRVALEHGVWLRPFRNLVYTMPPYVTSPEETRQIAAALTTAVGSVHG